MTAMTGSAWKFEGLLEIDYEICSWSFARELLAKNAYSYEALGRQCLTAVDPDFPDKVKTGDILVGEACLGYGHDHPHGCHALLGAGIRAVVCDSAAPYFLRNCIESGLPILEIENVSQRLNTGDTLSVDLVEGTLTNVSRGDEIRFTPLPDFILEVLSAGGSNELARRELQAGRESSELRRNR